jgi:hypothetical protein
MAPAPGYSLTGRPDPDGLSSTTTRNCNSAQTSVAQKNVVTPEVKFLVADLDNVCTSVGRSNEPAG